LSIFGFFIWKMNKICFQFNQFGSKMNARNVHINIDGFFMVIDRWARNIKTPLPSSLVCEGKLILLLAPPGSYLLKRRIEWLLPTHVTILLTRLLHQRKKSAIQQIQLDLHFGLTCCPIHVTCRQLLQESEKVISKTIQTSHVLFHWNEPFHTNQMAALFRLTIVLGGNFPFHKSKF